jgi:hypothetical protein
MRERDSQDRSYQKAMLLVERSAIVLGLRLATIFGGGGRSLSLLDVSFHSRVVFCLGLVIVHFTSASVSAIFSLRVCKPRAFACVVEWGPFRARPRLALVGSYSIVAWLATKWVALPK